ncbi:hypothetical protein [Streptosporangium amethystogenes]|uniref:hypothetical protein n=1 Tax=Streptosporangium amethystogenes TaxID=2002 RepID=UPI0012FB41DA|nr:hypothetical protein [Streptosporangium amethystogenes]
MVKLRPLAGVILTSVLLTGSIAVTPAAASTAETVTVSITEAAARPSNGKILYSRYSRGQGTLKIKNGNRTDTVVTLVRGRSKALSVYVRARSTATVRVVKDGTYTIFYTSGYRFSTSRGRFTRDPSYRRFDKRLRFVTTSTSTTIWTLTLTPIRGGNARTRGVSPGDFPA